MKKYYISFYLFSILALSYGQTDHIPWKTSSPEEQGMNSLTFINGINHFKQDNINIHSLLVIKNNKIVLDAYFYPFQKKYVHDLASVTKSVTSLLIGIAIDKGYIKDENQLVLDFFPEYVVKSDTLKRLRIKDLLNMTSGLQCSWNDGEKELMQMRETSDWVSFMFSLPFETTPGIKFSYCSGNFYLLAEILQRTTKMTCLDFARKYLFQPMNFGETYWQKNSKGVNHGWGDLYISTYDMARIGCLILDDGKWNSKQIISKEWIDKIKPLYKIQKTESYGYGWWLDSENPDEVQAVGRGGQRLFIFRDSKIVIATTGGGYEAGDIDNLVLESVKAYNKNENYSAQLKSILETIQSPGTKGTKITKDNIPSRILDKTIQFEKNELKLNSFRLEQKSNDYYCILEFTDGSREEHPLGMDDQYRISNEHVMGLPVALKGSWDNHKLIIIYNALCRINLIKLTFDFSDVIVNIDVQDLTDNWNQILKGRILQ